MNELLSKAIENNVNAAISEDVGSGDITAQLIDADKQACAKVITRESAIICGTKWVDAVFHAIDPTLEIKWFVNDRDNASQNETLFTVSGSARSILTGERAALNFLQTLSGTATTAKHYANLVAHTQVKLLDTRKTLPGLRLAQKHAVTCGDCHNHRIGLYDAFLIKENHIMACGGIGQAVNKAQQLAPGKPIEVEVESIQELQLALQAQADIVMLDNFPISTLNEAVKLNKGQAKLEASGGITNETLVPIAETGVDFISIGALTKDCKSIDLSMRIDI
ncbi:nicotinate-nucleotide diphosphorylase (carboxylating) [Oleiphilus sp. HI0081]|uniref:carboxylating nicotinate-nucleotide diphosphorylase n=3 Tax=Oleiphilus TaxID=141450 RepID=UPI0007C221FD|nr:MULTISPECIES: carboxylating nicotinate-nucleotide diphosphorylase [unclassified Oleiphilus]KZY44444.1 nicotinate-nucleotide diphosphorylase (carboxylating) [Oleiphilus sp. HI0050]KZY84084.1 nicotinate-nucleotide diphosphorylase (carboxylating) [Oleiphilus sp. HI0069]KZY88907.1 nicotinate-nucleotide diphosphorylase (carboxylating) [Oleiphilus sp. HI0072]KZZ15511.1 nicotinate-nucleotide diphosphorylase (carboxylating) [Oleiphilus sp. HI0078]KZZ21157.1 nicotinate-nucleotide diphosphorylase (ca